MYVPDVLQSHNLAVSWNVKESCVGVITKDLGKSSWILTTVHTVGWLGSRLFGKQVHGLLCVVLVLWLTQVLKVTLAKGAGLSRWWGHSFLGVSVRGTEKHSAIVSTQTEDQELACPLSFLWKHSGMYHLLEETVHEKLIASVFK